MELAPATPPSSPDAEAPRHLPQTLIVHSANHRDAFFAARMTGDAMLALLAAPVESFVAGGGGGRRSHAARAFHSVLSAARGGEVEGWRVTRTIPSDKTLCVIVRHEEQPRGEAGYVLKVAFDTSFGDAYAGMWLRADVPYGSHTIASLVLNIPGYRDFIVTCSREVVAVTAPQMREVVCGFLRPFDAARAAEVADEYVSCCMHEGLGTVSSLADLCEHVERLTTLVYDELGGNGTRRWTALRSKVFSAIREVGSKAEGGGLAFGVSDVVLNRFLMVHVLHHLISGLFLQVMEWHAAVRAQWSSFRHNDLSAHNCMVTLRGKCLEARVIDLGLASFRGIQASALEDWMLPEFGLSSTLTTAFPDLYYLVNHMAYLSNNSDPVSISAVSGILTPQVWSCHDEADFNVCTRTMRLRGDYQNRIAEHDRELVWMLRLVVSSLRNKTTLYFGLPLVEDELL